MRRERGVRGCAGGARPVAYADPRAGDAPPPPLAGPLAASAAPTLLSSAVPAACALRSSACPRKEPRRAGPAATP
eukprot:488193-Pleurochrysis_carterae.AAC.1